MFRRVFFFFLDTLFKLIALNSVYSSDNVNKTTVRERNTRTQTSVDRKHGVFNNFSYRISQHVK